MLRRRAYVPSCCASRGVSITMMISKTRTSTTVLRARGNAARGNDFHCLENFNNWPEGTVRKFKNLKSFRSQLEGTTMKFITFPLYLSVRKKSVIWLCFVFLFEYSDFQRLLQPLLPNQIYHLYKYISPNKNSYVNIYHLIKFLKFENLSPLTLSLMTLSPMTKVTFLAYSFSDLAIHLLPIYRKNVKKYM